MAIHLSNLPAGYIAITPEFSYAPLRVGLSLRHESGAEIYFQPGDAETEIREEIAALDEIDDQRIRDNCALIVFSDHFVNAQLKEQG